MKLFRFDPEVGKSIEAHGSSEFVISRITHLLDEAIVNCAHLEANGVIGFHQAVIPQLFLVVQGEGWVRSASPERTSIQAGQAAYWGKGEWHESGTEMGMMAIIIEGVNIDFSQLVPFE
jgi:quercetin dioxygenase-like cupin family protein